MEKRGSGAISPPTWVQAIEFEGSNVETKEIDQWVRTLSGDSTFPAIETTTTFADSNCIQDKKDSEYFIDIGNIYLTF